MDTIKSKPKGSLRQVQVERDILAKACDHGLPTTATRRLTRPRADCSKPKPKYPYVRCARPLIYQPEVFTAGWSARCVIANRPTPLLTAQIRQAFVASDETYGMPRICAELQDVGVMASRKRITRLMRQAQIRGVSRRCSLCVTTKRDVRHRPAPDLVNR